MGQRREVGPAAKRHTGRGENPSPRGKRANRAGFPQAALYFLARFSMGSKSRMATPV